MTKEHFKTLYDLKRKREAMGTGSVIERYVERPFFDTTPQKVEYQPKTKVKGIYEQMIEL